MPNFGYHFARLRGRITRAAYCSMLPAIAARPIQPITRLAFEVFSYSSERDLPEQVASIRSFLRYAGRPEKFTVVSDGSHTQESRDLLARIDPSVTVSQAAAWMPNHVPAELQKYLREHPTGKQLALIMCLPVDRPVLYVDSDVLFFAGARDLSSLLSARDAPALYLADCRLSADERLFRSLAEKERPVNTGVLFLLRQLDWSLSLDRLSALEGAPTFFTNQTMTHLTMHANAATALDPQKFVLQLDDQFVYPDHYAGRKIVLRHYVNPVRHKFWCALWP